MAALARTTTDPAMGDRARLLALFDAALEMPLVRLDVLESRYPCATETLRAWAWANRIELESSLGVLRLRVNGWALVTVHQATGGAT
jgi:hypothetical protein